jgi:hypothetical protein
MRFAIFIIVNLLGLSSLKGWGKISGLTSFTIVALLTMAGFDTLDALRK